MCERLPLRCLCACQQEVARAVNHQNIAVPRLLYVIFLSFDQPIAQFLQLCSSHFHQSVLCSCELCLNGFLRTICEVVDVFSRFMISRSIFLNPSFPQKPMGITNRWGLDFAFTLFLPVARGWRGDSFWLEAY
ncbi:hypothetical protein KP509_27G019700 [Ceratopteris richardii]|uniref:Uncharacterized protein n=1 Tax=Ceratopteris richardii TaxID=49495 RepID=A0A8T2RGR5_CERRI|nr:hypothetical protein KP509_27G019700 [Ceratopteris richardii]